jgi:hypothetical protein
LRSLIESYLWKLHTILNACSDDGGVGVVGGTWYREACYSLRFKYVHTSFEKSLIEMAVQYFKARSELN